MSNFIFGLLFGFAFSFFVLKFTINRSGYGQLKMCRAKCPYYRSVELKEEEDNKGEEGIQVV